MGYAAGSLTGKLRPIRSPARDRCDAGLMGASSCAFGGRGGTGGNDALREDEPRLTCCPLTELRGETARAFDGEGERRVGRAVEVTGTTAGYMLSRL